VRGEQQVSKLAGSPALARTFAGWMTAEIQPEVKRKDTI
jgi:hypothetical protein